MFSYTERETHCIVCNYYIHIEYRHTINIKIHAFLFPINDRERGTLYESYKMKSIIINIDPLISVD